MQAQDYIALVSALLSWPVAVVIIVLMYRTELRRLLASAKRISAGPISVEAELESAEEDERRASGEPAPPGEGVTADRRVSDWDALALTDPTGLVMKAWASLERRLVQAAKVADPAVTTRMPVREVLDALRRRGRVDAPFVSAVWNLRLVRNKVAHSRDVVPTSGQARTFAETAQRLEGRLD